MENCFKIVCFDMDGTLILNTNSVEYLCTINNKKTQFDTIDREGIEKGLSWIETDYIKAKLMGMLSVEKINHLFDKYIVFIEGIQETVDYLKGKGFKVILVTSGPVVIAEIVAKRFGFDMYFGSEYQVKDGFMTGKIVKHTGNCGKLSCLSEYCKEIGSSYDNCIAIGDGFSDIDLFEKCGKSIAINYEQCVEGKAGCYIKTNDLKDIIKFI